MTLKFCQQNRQFLDGDLHMHMFPTLVFITEEDKNADEELKKRGWVMPNISKQKVYVLGDLLDRIIVATNDDYIHITNRNSANLNYWGFTIEIDKNNNDISVSEYDAQSGFFNRYSTKEDKHDKHPLLSMFPQRNQPEPEIVLERCFSKINSVSNINEFVDMNQIKTLVANRLLENETEIGPVLSKKTWK